MKRFIVAAAIAAVLGLGYSTQADAQIVFGHSVPNGSGMLASPTFVAPSGFNNLSLVSTPRGVMIEPTFGTPIGVNRFNEIRRLDEIRRNEIRRLDEIRRFEVSNGMSFNNNFFRPNPFFHPNTFMNPNMFGNTFGGFTPNN